MFDTGAEASMIRADVLRREFPGLQPTPSGKVAVGFNGTRQPTLGAVPLRVVVEPKKPPVLGLFEVVQRSDYEMIFGALEMERYEIDIQMRDPTKGGKIRLPRPKRRSTR